MKTMGVWSGAARLVLVGIAVCGCTTEEPDDVFPRPGAAAEAHQDEPQVPPDVAANLEAIFRGAEAYYLAEHIPDGGGDPLTQRFPEPSVGPTPALGTCCSQGGLCSVCDPCWSQDRTWGPDALNFSVDVPQAYVYWYSVVSHPGATDGSNWFMAIANGDLDCDASYSTFTLTGVAGESGVSSSGIIAHHWSE